MVEANKHIFVKHFLGRMRLMKSAQSQNTAEDWFNKGVALYGQGNYADAIQAFDEAIMLDPKYATSWYYKGNALRMLHCNFDAEAAYAKARELGYSGPMTQLETTV